MMVKAVNGRLRNILTTKKAAPEGAAFSNWMRAVLNPGGL
jgi:hypothetical protein